MPLDSDLHKAANMGDTNEVETLVAEGAAIDARGAQGRTPLHRALGSGSTETASWLIQRDADPRIVDAMKRTALHWAAVAPSAPGNVDCCVLLLDCGVALEMLNCPSKSGSTPLHYALSAEPPHTDVARLLLTWGADPSLVDEDGKSAHQLAKEAKVASALKKELSIGAHRGGAAATTPGGSKRRGSKDTPAPGGMFGKVFKRAARRVSRTGEEISSIGAHLARRLSRDEVAL